ncbi:MAG: polyphosphate kinase 1 [Candidatus Dormibacteraeota bacterium]|nr:polyphosphate kinase 1 [Candidatus Dormibacteraeota bacterium]MBV9524364.1 polyphosphate kinase 1 [Candidatus Dormibacteraeota bacterium]
MAQRPQVVSPLLDVSTRLGPVPARESLGGEINRELSWLDFNTRVLALAEDERTPLLERAKFLAICSRNLDEFFQVRVGGLKQQLLLGVAQRSPDGMTPREQLRAIRSRVSDLVMRQSYCFGADVALGLERAGVRLVDWASLDRADRDHLSGVFTTEMFPVLTPLAVDPAHPFPYISNLSLNLAVVVRDMDTQTSHVARIKVPPLLQRFVPLRDGERFVPVEQVIAAHLDELFPHMRVVSHHSFRLTRNADYDLEAEEAEDLLEAVQSVLEQRRRSPLAVRLEVESGTADEVCTLLTRELDLESDDVYSVTAPLDLGGLWELYAIARPDLKYPAWAPVTAPPLAAARGESPPDIFRVLRARDVLVHHPYESFATSVEAFVEQAAADPRVLAIKQTLYRTSGSVSPIIHALVRAAESGKQVVALIELTARFDEQANIEWAQMLEDAGVHVVYGIVGLKTHAKLTLVVRQEESGIRRYCHLGSGNYNPDTARVYEDVGLFTGDAGFGADLSDLFNLLTGYSRQREYHELLVAPLTLRSELIDLIDRESKPGGLIAIKVNSLVDGEIIQALYRASQSGADVDLLVRGICCLRAGVPGLSERIRVRSIVGRYLEHSRIYRFGAPPDAAHFVGSADMMPRNLDRRLEVLFPVLAPTLRERLDEIFEVELADDALAWELKGDTWSRVPESEGLDAQERLQQLALERARTQG